MEKKAIRSNVINQLNKMQDEERLKKSEQIMDRLFRLDIWKEADIVATTMPMEHEVDTKVLIKECWRINKVVVVPKCNHKTREMQFFQINSFSELEKGYFGILEPIEDKCKKIKMNEIDLIVVPGVAFTVKGDRLGYGGGYYDRYLENYNRDIVALAYDVQIIDYIPTEEHDIVMPVVITETQLIKA